jgi:hypothetical protein
MSARAAAADLIKLWVAEKKNGTELIRYFPIERATQMI